jgi:hypothetical protein
MEVAAHQLAEAVLKRLKTRQGGRAMTRILEAMDVAAAMLEAWAGAGAGAQEKDGNEGDSRCRLAKVAA